MTTEVEARPRRLPLRSSAQRPRRGDDTMAASRSTCPRLSVGGDALLAGLVAVRADGSVIVTAAGQERLSA